MNSHMMTWCSIVNAPSKIARRKGERRLDERSEMADGSCGMELQSWVETETLDAVPRLDDETLCAIYLKKRGGMRLRRGSVWRFV